MLRWVFIRQYNHEFVLLAVYSVTYIDIKWPPLQKKRYTSSSFLISGGKCTRENKIPCFPPRAFTSFVSYAPATCVCPAEKLTWPQSVPYPPPFLFPMPPPHNAATLPSLWARQSWIMMNMWRLSQNKRRECLASGSRAFSLKWTLDFIC